MHDPVDPVIRNRAVAAARGLEPFDVLLVGATVVDVGTGELRPADVGLVGPLIASVHAPGHRTDALDTVDVAGRFLAPGFIDMHVHFESSMLTPGGLRRGGLPQGHHHRVLRPPRAGQRVRGRRRALHGGGQPGPAGALHRAGAVVRAAHPGPRAVGRRPARRRGAPRCWPGPRWAGWPRSWTCGGVLGRADRMVEVVAAGLSQRQVDQRPCGRAHRARSCRPTCAPASSATTRSSWTATWPSASGPG